MPPILHRSFNVAVGFVGTVNTGKTCAATSYCVELARDCYVLAHDVGWSIPTHLPDGRETRVVRHASIAAGEHFIATAGGQNSIHAFEGDATEVIRLAERLANASLHSAGGYDRPAHPVVVFIDEAVMALKDMSPHRMSPMMQELLARRRHKHIGVVWTTQHPGFVHHLMLSMGSKVYLFRCEGDKAMDRFREAGIPEDVIEEVEYLDDHHHIEFVFGRRKQREEVDDADGATSGSGTDEGGEPVGDDGGGDGADAAPPAGTPDPGSERREALRTDDGEGAGRREGPAATPPVPEGS